jgi:hypothetical protein
MNLKRAASVTALFVACSTLTAIPAAATEAPPKGGPCGIVGVPSIDYPDMVVELNRIAEHSHGRVTVHSAGTSTQGRDLVYAKVGNGSTKYFVWARIHGNEHIGTQPILDILEEVSTDSSVARKIRSELTIIAIPIWNVDGSELGQRVGAPIPGFPNGQDLNRDWISPFDPRPVPAGSSSFVYPESRSWYDLYATERPDYVQDIHQFANAASDEVEVLPGTTDIVEIQIGTAHESEFVSPEQLLASQRMGQVALATVGRSKQSHPARFDLGSAEGTSPRSALRRMIGGGQGYAGNPFTPHSPDGGFFFEVRNGTNTTYLEDLVHDGTIAVLRTLANADLDEVDATEFNALPNPGEAPCAEV